MHALDGWGFEVECSAAQAWGTAHAAYIKMLHVYARVHKQKNVSKAQIVVAGGTSLETAE